MTNTAEVLAQAATSFANTSGITAILIYVLAGIIGICLSPANQNLIEHWADPLVDQLLKLLPLFAQPFKGVIKSRIMVTMPSIFALILTKVAVVLGVDPKVAAAGCLSLIGGTHAYNGTDAAAGAKAAAVLLVLGMLAMPGHSYAEVAISNSGTFGSSIMSPGAGGALQETGATLVGDEFNFGWGSVDAKGSFTDYLMLSLGGGLETRDSKQYGDLLLGLGTTIPDTGTNVVVGPAWRLFTGAKYPGIAVTASFRFGSPIWMGK